MRKQKKGMFIVGLLAVMMLVCTGCGQESEYTPSPVVQYFGKSVQNGSIVYFGQYEQDGNTENGLEPIAWKVINTSGDQLTLVSVDCLEIAEYDVKEDVFLESALYTWLNTEFYNTAFLGEEQALIQGEHKVLLPYGYNEVAGPAEYTLAVQMREEIGDGYVSYWKLRDTYEFKMHASDYYGETIEVPMQTKNGVSPCITVNVGLAPGIER